MNQLSENDKINLSFPDCKVINMDFNFINKKIEIHLDGCWVESYEGLADDCVITISDWKHFEATSYDSTKNEYLNVDIENLDMLDDIPVFEYGSEIVLEGFGRNVFLWMKYKFHDAKLEGWYGEKVTYE